ncbi:MCE family protein [bacterium]|nr:MCE family protein [bacterium]
MDAEKRTEIIVGAVVVIGLVLLVLGLIWGKGLKIFDARQEITAHFTDVRGLEAGDPVMIRGMKKGEVQEIDLYSDYVEVKLWIKKDVNLYKDLKVCVEDREMMGGKMLTLFPGTVGESADLTKIFWGTTRSDMMLLMLKVDNVLTRVDSVFMRIHQLANEVPVKTLVTRLDAAVESAAAAVDENRGSVKRSLARLDNFLMQLERDSTTVRIASLLAGMNTMTYQLDSTLYELKHLASQLTDSTGTSGRLMRDAALYNNMVITVSRIDSLIVDVKRNPKKYLKVSVF